MEKLKNKPSLRFPEFDRKWENCKLGDITYKVDKKNKTKELLPIYSINNYNGFTPQSEQFEGLDSNERGYDISLYKIIENNTFAYNPARINVGSIGYSGNLDRLIVSSLYVCFKTKENINNDFFYKFVKTDRFINYVNKMGEGGVRIYLFYENFSLIPFSFPTLAEQTKITSFLTAVDDKLDALKLKKTLLEQYKKGVMQKIFSQELRFKDDNGNGYPDWEEKKLGDIGYTYNGLTGKTKEHFGNGKPYIQYKQIFDDSKIDISRFELVKISPSENQNKVVFGDVFFTVSSETPNEIGTASVLLNDIDELYLNSFCFGYRASKLTLSPYFSRYLFRNELFRNQIIKLAQGSTRFNMSKLQLIKLIVKLPCLEEQTKIANFLNAIDDKINHCHSQIEKTEVWKKGLLQQMFC